MLAKSEKERIFLKKCATKFEVTHNTWAKIITDTESLFRENFTAAQRASMRPM